MVPGQVTEGLQGHVAGQQLETTATAFWAHRSAVSDIVREPVNHQMTITLASASIALPSAQPTRAIEPAAKPAISPATPSAVIHAREAQASQRARRAARTQRSPRPAAGAAAQPSQQPATTKRALHRGVPAGQHRSAPDVPGAGLACLSRTAVTSRGTLAFQGLARAHVQHLLAAARQVPAAVLRRSRRMTSRQRPCWAVDALPGTHDAEASPLVQPEVAAFSGKMPVWMVQIPAASAKPASAVQQRGRLCAAALSAGVHVDGCAR